MRLLIVLFTFLLSTNFANRTEIVNETDPNKEGAILYTLMGIVDYLHYNPKQVNDKLSEEIWEDYLKMLDGSKRLLLQSEVNSLKKHRTEIDDQINQFQFDFFNASEELIIQANKRAEEFYKSLIDQEIDLHEEEFMELDGSKRKFATDELELVTRWRKFIKYNILTKVDSYKSNEEFSEMSTEDLIEKARKSTKEMFDDYFVRVSKSRREDRFEQFMNAIILQEDPHSLYLSPKEKENFDIQMGNKLEGIGARLQQADEYVKVYSIVPGGPAWKGDELEEEDVIYSVKQEGEDPVDITGWRVDDVIPMIRGDKGTKVTLKVKKKNGVFQNITIIRDEVILDEAAARSLILGLEREVENIGYIHLPMFYSTFDGGNSCAIDVAKELEKLNNENVNGVILDLRYNRGGSLPDAIDMAGLFFKDGPVVQVKDRQSDSQIYSDENPEVNYDGPLIVLVNEVSASSSEIVAGALQDYNRALIVGGKKTYGKGTVQGVYDLDRMLRDQSELKPLGQVKLTTQKFYRVSGESNQKVGIIPDISYPDQFENMEYGEEEDKDALNYSKIDAVKYGQDIYQVRKRKQLISNSQERVAKNPKFQKVKEYSELVQQNRVDTKVNLALLQYQQDLKDNEKMFEPFDKIFEVEIEDLKVRNLKVDEEYIAFDDSRKARNIDFIEDITNDYELEEALRIMGDIISIDKRLAQK